MKISYVQCYGKACYEMSGDRYRKNGINFKDFIIDVLKINKSDLNGENKIPMPIRYALVRGVFEGGFGDNYGISYEDIKIEKKNVKKKELLDEFKDIHITYSKMDSLKHRTLENLLRI